MKLPRFSMKLFILFPAFNCCYQLQLSIVDLILYLEHFLKVFSLLATRNVSLFVVRETSDKPNRIKLD